MNTSKLAAIFALVCGGTTATPAPLARVYHQGTLDEVGHDPSKCMEDNGDGMKFDPDCRDCHNPPNQACADGYRMSSRTSENSWCTEITCTKKKTVGSSRGTHCASFKLVVYDRPDMILKWKGKDKTRPVWRFGNGPDNQPQPKFEMKQLSGAKEGSSCRSLSDDPEALVECCFELGSKVELHMVAGKYSSTGLLGPVEADMSPELLAEIMPAPKERTSMDPPISVFGKTIKKNWGDWNLNTKWSNEQYYKINSWGPESATNDQRLCYDVHGKDQKFGDYTNWQMLRADDREVVCESDRKKFGNASWKNKNRGGGNRMTECCYIKGSEMILYLGPHTRNKGFLKFMGLEIKATKQINEIEFVWGEKTTLQRHAINA